MSDDAAVKIGGTMCDGVVFVASDNTPIVGIQLYIKDKPEAFFAMDPARARMALKEFERIVERAELVKQN